MHVAITCKHCGTVTQRGLSNLLQKSPDRRAALLAALRSPSGSFAWCEGCDTARNVGQDFEYVIEGEADGPRSV